MQELQQRILSEAVKLPFTIDKVKELTDIALSALGIEFFKNIKYKNERITGERLISHPLLRVLNTTNGYEAAISELMEIGLYLREFCYDQAIAECINNLRLDTQYESTLFQISFAYRFKKLGFKVKLEPATTRGKSDIFLDNGQNRYMVECYRINKTFCHKDSPSTKAGNF